MLKALGILLFAVTLEAGFLYTIVAPHAVSGETVYGVEVAAAPAPARS
jgi:hypothetical protein